MTSVLYEAGTVTITSGNTRVVGQNTAWLKKDIKQHDIFSIGAKFYEISDVTSNTELILAKAYTGESVEAAEYTIIQIAEQVISADLAKQVQELVDKYNAREAEMAESIAECKEYTAMWKQTGLFIDSDGDIAQDEVPSTPTVIINGEPATLTTSADIRELTDELHIGQ
ncbi:MAG: hypothetical protein IJP91_00680 [Synergistaceae bacterium]|nr:hypothetical protein [Synergistaceae bacterium]